MRPACLIASAITLSLAATCMPGGGPPGPEEIHPRELPEADWMYIVEWAMRLKEAGFENRTDIQTFFDFIELDEGRDPAA